MFQNQSLGLILSDFVSLFYPNYCACCNITLSPSENTVCIHCLNQLQETKLHERQPNELHQRFYEMPELRYAFAYCWFQNEGIIQKLLHQLKYKGHTEIGIFLGERYGQLLADKNYDKTIDIICSVPLHFKKYKKRGYNQADLIAEGLAKTFNKPFKRLLKKEYNLSSQTKKHRIERFQNVEDSFSLLSKQQIKNKHILVVDDVLTTGATMQAACQPLLKAGATMSILTIAAVR